MDPLFEELPIDPSDPVDFENCVIRGIALTRNRSDHGRIYEESAMLDLVKVSEGSSVYLDGHVPVGTQRMATRRNGVIKNIRRAGEYNRGDWHLLKSHADTGALLEAADEAPGSIMISHEVMEYEGEAERDGLLHIKGVKKFRDYALVTAGGTTKSLYEDDQMTVEFNTADDVKKHRPEIFECICAAAKQEVTADHDKKLAEVMAELDAARGKISELESKLAEHDAKALESARVEEIFKEAEELKVTISEETAEQLAKLDKDGATTIIKGMLTEGEEPRAQEDKRPQSDSGAPPKRTSNRRFGRRRKLS